MALEVRSRDAIRRHWGERLGCAETAFETAGVTITEQPGQTVRFLRRREATVVAGPGRVRGVLADRRDALGEQPLTTVGDELHPALAGKHVDVAAIYGPSVLSYVDATTFAGVPSDARLLDSDDEEAFGDLRRRVPDTDWDRASPTFRPHRTTGLFEGGELVAVASLAETSFPDVGVVVDPDHRDAGYGQQVVSRMLTAAFEQNPETIPRYRTPQRESASLSLAASLGFERWASETVVVLD